MHTYCIHTCIRGVYNIALNIVRTADKIFYSVLRELRDNETSAWLRRWSTRDVERQRERERRGRRGREFCLFLENVSKVLTVNVRGQFISSVCTYVCIYEERLLPAWLLLLLRKFIEGVQSSRYKLKS